MSTQSSTVYDVLIVGGGPAGLSAALSLARVLHSVVVFDSGVYRNQKAEHMHTLPTWDHHSPSEYRAAARQELLTRYKTVSFQDTSVSRIVKNEAGLFEATTADAALWKGKKVILATGSRDVLLDDIQGYDECWVKGVFHCLFCHGYEDRGKRSAGVLAVGDLATGAGPALVVARQARTLADKVTLYTNGSDDFAQALEAAISPHQRGSIKTDSRSIAQLVKEAEGSDVTVRFADGTEPAREGFLAHKPKLVLNGSSLAADLGLELTPQGDIKTLPPGVQTSVDGVFAAGDCGTMLKTVANAVASGSNAAAFVSMQVLAMPPPQAV